MSLDDSLRRTLHAKGERPAIRAGDEVWSWRNIGYTAEALDKVLAQHGVGAGAAVCLIARNRPAQVAALLGLPAYGRCATIVSGLQGSERAAEDLRRMRPAALVATADELATPEIVEVLRELQIPALCLTGRPEAPVETLFLAPVGRRLPMLPSVAVQVLTSGTTGLPKRIPLGFDMLQQAMDDLEVMLSDVESRDGKDAAAADPAARPPILLFHPLANISGLYLALYAGVVGRPMELFERFRVEDWVAAVERHRPRLLWLPPPAIRMVVDAEVPAERLAGALAMRSGAAPLAPALRDRFEQRYGIPILSHYGASEFGGIVADWTLADHRRFGEAKRGSVGRARPGMALRVVVPDSGEACLVGDVGLLEVLVPRVGPEWIRTTDLARLDADGFLFLEGRADDAINRGGFKILPEQVAEVLRTHAGVRDAVVVGLPDPRLGQVPAAAVVLRDPASGIGAAEIERYARSRLLAYQVPSCILFLEELPRTGTMKVDRQRLLALFGSISAS